MAKIKDWLTNSDKQRIIRIIVSGIALIFSLGKWLDTPFDMAWIAIVLCGVPIVFGAAKALTIEHNIKADLLVSMALLGSLYIGEFFAAGEVAFIMEIGSLLEDTTAAKTKKGIEKLIKLTPKTARVKRNGTETIIPTEEVIQGDVLIVLAGETVPVDGVIISGNTSIDQSVMTGESIPVDKAVGDSVISGSVNQFGTFEMEALHEEKDSSLQRMIRLAKEADENKAPIVSLMDKWATWMVIVAFIAAIVTGFVTGQLIRAVTVLVVFCPCSFVLATPTAIMAAIGNATKYGILIRSGDALERLAGINIVAFDKTGTITNGKPKVIGVESFTDNYDNSVILQLAALAEQRSEHPLGKAILNAYVQTGGVLQDIDDFALIAGHGVSAKVDGKSVLAGKEALLLRNGIEVNILEGQKYLDQGATVIYVSVDSINVGLITLADTIREDAPNMISRLKELDIEPILLTGDNEASAKQIASLTGIQNVRADLLPEDKMTVINDYEGKSKKVCMIGDGINDSLALNSAYASVAMGGIGCDIAVESSDAVLVQDDIRRVPYLLGLSKKALKTININITFSLCLNLIAVVLAATGILNPVFGALVHNCGSVAVVINSALLLRVKDK